MRSRFPRWFGGLFRLANRKNDLFQNQLARQAGALHLTIRFTELPHGFGQFQVRKPFRFLECLVNRIGTAAFPRQEEIRAGRRFLFAGAFFLARRRRDGCQCLIPGIDLGQQIFIKGLDGRYHLGLKLRVCASGMPYAAKRAGRKIFGHQQTSYLVGNRGQKRPGIYLQEGCLCSSFRCSYCCSWPGVLTRTTCLFHQFFLQQQECFQ